MNLRATANCHARPKASASERGSALVIVLWISFGLVTLALYFADTTRFELRAADNRVSSLAAEHAIDGAVRYITYLFQNAETNGVLPDPLLDYANEWVTVGAATFWIMGRNDQQVNQPTFPAFGFVDEASKINLNTATIEVLEGVPGMTVELAAAIIDWRDADSDITENGAEDETYGRLQPPRRCKNAPFETVAELRLVAGAELTLLYGEDWNLNGILDPNEDDGQETWPNDNSDGRLDPGMLEYFTVYSREPNTRGDGSARINVNTGGQTLTTLLTETFGDTRGQEISTALGNNPGVRSLLEFFIRSGMSADEFDQIHTELTVTNLSIISGLINVNTASQGVLSAIPGIGVDKVANVIAFRQQNPTRLTSVAWLAEALDEESAIQAGPYLTAQSYQFTADIAALGPNYRGFRRERVVFDTTENRPKVLLREDLTPLGWSMGTDVRYDILIAKETGQ